MKLADNPSAMLRRLALWVAPLLLVITVILMPITNSWIKLFQLFLLGVTLVGCLATCGSRGRVAVIVGMLLAASLFLLPGRNAVSRQRLSLSNERALLRYEGVNYWWGGENAMGIDCSGLIRRGMMDAALREGLLTLDGSLLRISADLWWHDSSAEALGQGYRAWTTPVTEARSLNVMDHSLVLPGDLAIAGGGSHILAYLGDSRWIQADPNAQKVIVETAPSKNGWFTGKVRIVRWTWMTPDPRTALPMTSP